MSFVTQEDVFDAIEPVLAGVFEEFADGKRGDPGRPVPAHPLRARRCSNTAPTSPTCATRSLIADVTEPFPAARASACSRRIVEGGGVVRAIPAPGTAEKSRKFFDDMNDWARGEGHAGLGYITQQGRRVRRADRQEPWRRRRCAS